MEIGGWTKDKRKMTVTIIEKKVKQKKTKQSNNINNERKKRMKTTKKKLFLRLLLCDITHFNSSPNPNSMIKPKNKYQSKKLNQFSIVVLQILLAFSNVCVCECVSDSGTCINCTCLPRIHEQIHFLWATNASWKKKSLKIIINIVY